MNKYGIATPHLVPGTDVLKNKFNITDKTALKETITTPGEGVSEV